MALAGCAFAPGATDPPAAHQRARAVLSAWADSVAAAGEHAAVTPVGELTGQIGDWEEAVGDNNKHALMAGMVAFSSPLSEGAPPDGEVTWQDGTTTKVPLLSAQQAIVAIESETGAPCPDCTMLLVTAAELASGPIQTSRGSATDRRPGGDRLHVHADRGRTGPAVGRGLRAGRHPRGRSQWSGQNPEPEPCLG